MGLVSRDKFIGNRRELGRKVDPKKENKPIFSRFILSQFEIYIFFGRNRTHYGIHQPKQDPLLAILDPREVIISYEGHNFYAELVHTELCL